MSADFVCNSADFVVISSYTAILLGCITGLARLSFCLSVFTDS